MISDSAEKFKLSSLPQLKKWEIPSMPQKYALRTGRKFKHIDEVFETGRKRGSHWSIKPELNFRELEFEEDAEKMKLDQNYKAFIEDDDIPNSNAKQEIQDAGKFASLSNQKIGVHEKRSKLSNKKDSNKRDANKKDSNKKDSNKKATKKKLTKTEEDHGKLKNIEKLKSNIGKSKQLSGTVGYEERKGIHEDIAATSPSAKVDLLDSSAGQGINRFSTADMKSNIQTSNSDALIKKIEAKRSVDTGDSMEEEISKRSIENNFNVNLMSQRNNRRGINDAARKARVAVNDLQNRKPSVTKPVTHPVALKTGFSKEGKMQVTDVNKHNKVQQKNIQQKNLQESRDQALKLLRNSANSVKGPMKSGVLGDQPSKSFVNKMKNSNEVMQANPSSANHVRASSLSPTNSHSFSPTQESQISQRAKIESPRGEIEKPKEKMKIVPANVARAVAMAMEQLKRDRMWGKVFVHVLPSGKLKVMVQETKKMPDE